MTIMRSISRLILRKSSTSSPPPRWLCTAAEKPTAAAPQSGWKSSIFYKVARANSKSSVADILNKWVNQGNEVKRSDIKNLTNYFRNRKNFHAALQLCDWMESNKFETNDAGQAVRINLLYKTEGVASAEKYFNNLQASEKTSKTYGALLHCYHTERDLGNAVKIFEQMKESNYTSTLNYNNMLSLYYGLEQHEKVFSLVQEMEEKDIARDIYTYNHLINSYAALKNFDGVDGVLEKMKSSNVEYDSFTLGNLATIYFNSGLHEKADAFLEMMEKMKSQPNENVFESCRTRIKLYSEMNNLSGVNRAWESLKSAFQNPSNTSYLFMLLALSKLGYQEDLEELFKEWEKSCSINDFRLPNVVLQYYLSRNMLEKATSLYESWAKRETEPNLKSLDLFAALCIKNCQIDLALKYLEKGLDKAKTRNGNWFPTDETVKLFLHYFEENSDAADSAEKFFQTMKTHNRLDSNFLSMKTK